MTYTQNRWMYLMRGRNGGSTRNREIFAYKLNEVPSQARGTDPQMLLRYEQTLLATDPPP